MSLQGQHACKLWRVRSNTSHHSTACTYRRAYLSPATRQRLLWTPQCDRRSAIADGCGSALQNDSLIGTAACDSSKGRAASGRFAALQHPKLRRGPLDSGFEGSALTRRLEIATRATHGRRRPSTRRGPLDVSASRAVAPLVAPRAYPEGERGKKLGLDGRRGEELNKGGFHLMAVAQTWEKGERKERKLGDKCGEAGPWERRG